MADHLRASTKHQMTRQEDQMNRSIIAILSPGLALLALGCTLGISACTSAQPARATGAVEQRAERTAPQTKAAWEPHE
jgi:hypothetical protein